MEIKIMKKFIIKTLGCKVNSYEIDVMQQMLQKNGYEIVDFEQKADIYITADMKYHEMQSAYGQIGLIDLDHWTSEHFTREIFEKLLGSHIITYIAESDITPIKWLTK